MTVFTNVQRIDGDLYLTQRDIDELTEILMRYDPDPEKRAHGFICEIDMRLWSFGEDRASYDKRHLWHKPIPKHAPERKQLEKLYDAARTIAEILDAPEGDLSARLEAWFAPAALESHALQLMAFSGHALTATQIKQGGGNQFSDFEVDECFIVLNTLRNHYPEITISDGSRICADVARVVLGIDDPRALIQRALHREDPLHRAFGKNKR